MIEQAVVGLVEVQNRDLAIFHEQAVRRFRANHPLEYAHAEPVCALCHSKREAIRPELLSSNPDCLELGISLHPSELIFLELDGDPVFYEVDLLPGIAPRCRYQVIDTGGEIFPVRDWCLRSPPSTSRLLLRLPLAVSGKK